MFPEKNLQNLEWYDSCQSRVSRRCGVNHTSVSILLSIIYFFKVDEAKKSVIDSYYLTKGKKEWIDSEK